MKAQSMLSRAGAGQKMNKGNHFRLRRLQSDTQRQSQLRRVRSISSVLAGVKSNSHSTTSSGMCIQLDASTGIGFRRPVVALGLAQFVIETGRGDFVRTTLQEMAGLVVVPTWFVPYSAGTRPSFVVLSGGLVDQLCVGGG